MKISKPFGLDGDLEVVAFYIMKPEVRPLAVTSSGKGTATVPLARRTDSFDVLLNVGISYDLRNFHGSKNFAPLALGDGSFEILAKWKANLSEDGLELQYSGDAPRGSFKSNGAIKVSMASAVASQSPTKAKKPFVNWEATLLAIQTDEGLGIGIGPVSADVFGGDSRGVALPLEFTLDFEVEKAPEKKAPTVKTLAFKIGPYDHGKTKTDGIKASSISDYYTWTKFKEAITKLPQATLDEWASGDPQFLRPKTIKLIGFADTTGPMSENDMKYAKGRADDVKKWIQAWTGASDSFFFVKSEGEGKGGTDKKPDEKKLARNRYVSVELSYIQ